MTATLDASIDAPQPAAVVIPRRRRMRALVIAASVLAAAAGLGWRVAQSNGADGPTGKAASMPASPDIENRYGVRLLGAYITAAGGMVEIQYQIIDPGKAASIHDDAVSPVIVRDETVFDAPGLTGHGHSKETPAAGRTGYVLLANTKGQLHQGDEVSLRVGTVTLGGVILG